MIRTSIPIALHSATWSTRTLTSSRQPPRSLVARPQRLTSDCFAAKKDCLDRVERGHIGEWVLLQQEQVSSFADFDRAQLVRQSQSCCIVERRRAKKEKQWSASVGPSLQFKPSIQPRWIAKPIAGGRVAAQDEWHMVRQHDPERRTRAFNHGFEQWLEPRRG